MRRSGRADDPGVPMTGVAMRRGLLAFVLSALMMACGGDGGGETPTQPRILPPPFEGAGDVGPDVVAVSDSSTLVDLTPLGQAMRLMHDDRLQDTATVNAHLFEALFADGFTTQVQVNPEMDSTTAHAEAQQYAHILGQMPSVLRSAVDTVWVQGGEGDWWAIWWAGTLLLHLDFGDELLGVGLAEEIMLHEMSHMGLEEQHDTTAAWLAAQEADQRFITDYAAEFPASEDMAESFVAWVAVRFRADRLDPGVLSTIEATIPNRLAYFDGLGLDLEPIR